MRRGGVRDFVLTVMAHIVSVLIDSVSVFRIGETALRNKTKITAGFT